jgi:hypothetical protein
LGFNEKIIVKYNKEYLNDTNSLRELLTLENEYTQTWRSLICMYEDYGLFADVDEFIHNNKCSIKNFM